MTFADDSRSISLREIATSAAGATDPGEVARRPPHAERLMGAVFESQSRFPIVSVAWVTVSIAMFGSAMLAGSVDVALVALLPLVWALGCLLYRPARCQLALRPSGLQVDFPPQHVPYRALQIIRWNGQAWRPDDRPFGPGRLTLIYRDGMLDLADLHSSSAKVDELYRFLWWFVNGSGSRDVNPKLYDYISQQESLYGGDQVYSFAAREQRGVRPMLRRLQACLWLSGLVGLFWLLGYRAVGADEAFWAAGWLTAVGGPLAAALVWAAHRPSGLVGQQLGDAGLVISPAGLALVQGPVEGTLKWNELQSVQGPDLVWGMVAPQLRLRVRGATIPIADVFDRPLIVVWQTLHRFWRPPPTLWA